MGRVKICQIALGAFFLLAVFAGLARGEGADVMQKAIAVCLECIGIG